MSELKQAFDELEKSIARLKKSLLILAFISLFSFGFVLGIMIGLLISRYI